MTKSTPSTHSRPSLHTLPSHIIESIAIYTYDELAIRHLGRTCRYIHYSVRAALKPYLIRKDLTVYPSLFRNSESLCVCREIACPFLIKGWRDEVSASDSTVFEPIDIRFASHTHPEQVNIRQDEISWMEGSFVTLLNQYSSAAQDLRQLSVEVLDYCTSMDGCGWKVMQRYAEQLEELEVIVYDDLWCDDANDEYGDSTIKKSAYNIEDDQIAWIRPSIDSELIEFTNLTHLTLAVTARVLDHLLNFAHGVPALIELRLGCHFRPDAEFDNVSTDMFAFSMLNSGAEFSKLERLSIGGSDQTASDVLETLLEYTPRLAHITLGISKSRTKREMMRLLTIVSDCKSLRGFAFYGGFVSKMVRCWAGKDEDGEPIRGFYGLEVLTLEAIRETHFRYVSEILNSVSPAFSAFQSSGLLCRA